MVQRCGACNMWQWGPEWICHRCHSFDLVYETTAAEGIIYSHQRVWHPVHPALKGAGPYIAVLVELADVGNIRMLGNLLGDPHQIVTIGAPVTAVFEPHDDARTPYTLVQWQLA